MKFLTIAMLAALCALGPATAVARPGSVGVQDLGQDGDERFFRIRCTAEHNIILTTNRKLQKACFLDKQEKEKCLHTLNVRDAGTQACQLTQ